MKRIITLLFLLSLIVLSSSAFFSYNQKQKQISEVPLKWDAIISEQTSRYEAEENRVLDVNNKIVDQILLEFESLGGDLKTLSRYDRIRLITGMETSNELLNTIEHEPFAYNSETPAMTEQEKVNEEHKDIAIINTEFKDKLIAYGYYLVISVLVYIMLLIAVKSLKTRKESL